MKKGFTLIELSIVLVIIGLIVGGVLVGRDMIRAAEIRSVISDVEKIQTAVNAFKLKYNCMPGDCLTATSVLTSVTNGDGNGRVGAFPTGATYGEVWQFWVQLAAANLWSGTFSGAAGSGGVRNAVPGTNVPATRMNPNVGYTVIYADSFTNVDDWSPSIWDKWKSHIIEIGTSHNNIYDTYAAGFTPVDAYNIDTKIDNGMPGTGTVVNFSNVYAPNCASTNVPTTATYILTNTSVACGLIVAKRF